MSQPILSQEQKTALELSLSRSTKSLYIDLGKESGRHLFPQDQMERGRKLFKRVSKNLQEEICNNKTVISILKSDRGDRDIILLSALIDIFSGMLIGVSPVTFFTLLVKRGIEEYCKYEYNG